MSDWEDVIKREDTVGSDEGPRLASPATFIPAEERDLESALGGLNYIEGRAVSVRWEPCKLMSTRYE